MFRTGIIGMGGIGRHLAEEVRSHPRGTIGAVVDVNEENLAAAGESFDLDPSALYVNEAEMYAEESLDAVVIATPPGFHFDQIRAAFDRDLHVLCEKPVVLDSTEASEVVRWVREEGHVLMAGYQRHLDPGFVAARDRWAEGDLDPTFATGSLTQDWRHHYEAGTNWRMDPDVGGGGHLFSVGTHVVESVLWMTGLTPVSVTAEMSFHDDERRVDEQSAMTVRFDNGAIASFGDSGVVPRTMEHIHVWDEEGAVYLEGEDWGAREFSVVDADGDRRTPDLGDAEARTKFEAFVDAVESGAEPPATAEDALRVTALLEAAYESARTGSRVDVDL
ncbi:Gfo/Idh/MocA family oxidoreductase [Halogeometricum sp. S1BR25-6]|uniref:Gfo/Idh/MocA family oxidoreductase n=1 Tax=Halogeometricum salsisoli TaxID=2950536 RepID=A0ABU2GIJ3_9EURY|nr:Gfo/Idh/MocA family oxidoreductase [Halogeometricum sp. S1BR25-6]MDS0300647.1 Gfo/Idh/MocA family oxidoreductase [Halogeometricum sp. S1BR25-6]